MDARPGSPGGAPIGQPQCEGRARAKQPVAPLLDLCHWGQPDLLFVAICLCRHTEIIATLSNDLQAPDEVRRAT